MILAGAFRASRAYHACVPHIYASETRLAALQLKQQIIFFFITPLVKAVSFVAPFALYSGIYVIRTCHFWRKYFDLSRKKIIPVISIRRYDVRVSAAFAPYRVSPFGFAPTLYLIPYTVRPHTFRVRPHQVEFAS